MNPIKKNYRLNSQTYTLASLYLELAQYIDPYGPSATDTESIEGVHSFIDDLREGNFKPWIDTFAELREENEDDSEALEMIDELAETLSEYIVDYTRFIESNH